MLVHDRPCFHRNDGYKADHALTFKLDQSGGADHNLSPTAETKQSELYLRYKIWCDSNGLRPVTKRVLNEQLSERGIGQRKSGSVRYYTGVELPSISAD